MPQVLFENFFSWGIRYLQLIKQASHHPSTTSGILVSSSGDRATRVQVSVYIYSFNPAGDTGTILSSRKVTRSLFSFLGIFHAVFNGLMGHIKISA